jgi:hypothetical protein
LVFFFTSNDWIPGKFTMPSADGRYSRRDACCNQQVISGRGGATCRRSRTPGRAISLKRASSRLQAVD